jgi:holo-[acyl-carrier protein] synthase
VAQLIGVGIDAVELDRFRAALARTPALVDRLFSDAERAYAVARRDPTERFAVRFAAKEAVAKALGVSIFAFDYHDVEVVRLDRLSAPQLRISGRAEMLALARGVRRWHVSLTHTERTATAIVIAQ